MNKIATLICLLALTMASWSQTHSLYQFDGGRGAAISSGDTIVMNQSDSQYHFRFELGVTGNTGNISSKVRVLRVNPNACFTYQLCSELDPDTGLQNACWDINSTDFMSPTLTNLDPQNENIVFYPKGVTCNGSTQLRFIVYVNDVVVDSVDYIINNVSLSTPSIAAKQTEISVAVYPNPANTLMTINTQGLDGNFDVKMTDVLGKVVYNESVYGASKKVDVSDFKNGVYLVTVLEKGKTVQTRRLVIRH